MTKQELYDAYSGKFDIVTPVDEWKKIGSVKLGKTRYDVDVYNEGEGFKTYTIYVEDDEGAGESAVIGGSDPLAVVPDKVTVGSEMGAFLEGKITDGTIEGYIPAGVQGVRFMEVFVYRNVAGVLEKELYLIWLKEDDTIDFRKIG